MEGGAGLIAHPTVLQVVATILVVLVLVFMIAAGDQPTIWVKKLFKKKA
jgi:hypothetical protein